MFSEEQVEAYKNITAPEEMRSRVLNSVGTQKKKSRSAVYRYAGLAACLVLIIALSLVFTSQGGVTIYSDGQVITEDGVPVYSAVSAMSARGMFGIELEAELDGKTVISASEGNVYINGQLAEGKIDAEMVAIVWDIVPTDTEKIYVLTFENSRGETSVNLLFNETAGWMLCCDK